MVDLRVVVPGAMVLCYFIYLILNLFRSELVGERLEQELQEEAQQELEALERRHESYKTLCKALRMEQIMNAMQFETLPDKENRTATGCDNTSDADEDEERSNRTASTCDDISDTRGGVGAQEQPDEENTIADSADDEVEAQEPHDEKSQTACSRDTTNHAQNEAKSQERPDGELFLEVKKSLATTIVSSERKGNKPECAICLESYKPGQVLCSAKSNRCHHIFHVECLIGWLQESDECPLCRVNLLETAEVSV